MLKTFHCSKYKSTRDRLLSHHQVEDYGVVIETNHDTPTNIMRTSVPKAYMNKRTQDRYDQHNRELDPFLYHSEGAVNGDVQEERA